IEKYIKKIALPYTFIRPSFFMENLISPHGKDIKTLNQIIVPARKSKTSFIAAKDIGEACGVSLHESDKHINQAYTITGSDALDYDEVAAMFSNHLGRKITYANPNMNDYGKHMISLGYPKDYVSVTKMLYFMTRLGTAKKTTSTIETLLGRKATSFDTFIKENLNIWL
ncbi:MAG TPA: NAD(P)-dependent oxidoreductase, partial [Acholeplasmataceae bacterium]|nr:NAD(P)-dependent oxidoreductase [Acholeplasmataceae bacterium]